jgi:hypothetical protein
MDDRLNFYLDKIAKLLDCYECDENGNVINGIECIILNWDLEKRGKIDKYVYDGIGFVKEAV